MNKKNLILGGVLLVLILGTWAFNGPIKDWREAWGKPKNYFAKLDFAQINQIELEKNNEQTKLILTDGRWKIDGTKDFYATSEIADLLKTALEKARDNDVELVSENPERKSDFGTDASGTTVRLKQGDEVKYEFIQGHASDDFTASYFSIMNDDKTYLAAANLNNAFVRSDWYDRTIFSSDKEKINKLRFQYPNSEFVIEKEVNEAAEGEEATETWVGVNPYRFSVDEEKIVEILDTMTNLQAVGIPEQSFEGTDLDKNLIIVEASGDEISNTIMVGNTQDEEAEDLQFFAKRGDSDNIYLIDQETRDLLDTSIRELR